MENINALTQKDAMAKEPMVAYHVTAVDNVPSILHNGLEPRIGANSALLYEPRPAVFMFKAMEDLHTALNNWLGELLDDDTEYCVFQVQLNQAHLACTEVGPYELQCYVPIEPEHLSVLHANVDNLSWANY